MQEMLLGFSEGRNLGPRATGDVKLKVVTLHLVHQVIAGPHAQGHDG